MFARKHVAETNSMTMVLLVTPSSFELMVTINGRASSEYVAAPNKRLVIRICDGRRKPTRRAGAVAQATAKSRLGVCWPSGYQNGSKANWTTKFAPSMKRCRPDRALTMKHHDEGSYMISAKLFRNPFEVIPQSTCDARFVSRRDMAHF